MRGDDRVSVQPLGAPDGEAFRAGLTRFVEEGRVMTRFAGHPNIARVIEAFEANGTAYLVMDYVGGLPLDKVRENAGGRLGQAEVVPIALQLLDGLGAIHAQGLLHRDVKPANIHIGDNGAVTLLDFGAARYASMHASQALSQIFTPRFAPLEQYQSRGRQGPPTDLYALGATLYLLLTGQAPPDATARVLDATLVPAHLVPGCDASPAVSAVLDRALQMSPNARWASAQEMRNALLQAVDTHVRPPAVAPAGYAARAPAAPVGFAARASAAPVGFAARASAVAVAPRAQSPAKPNRSQTSLVVGIAGGLLVLVWAAAFLPAFFEASKTTESAPKSKPKSKPKNTVAPADCPEGTSLEDGECVPESEPAPTVPKPVVVPTPPASPIVVPKDCPDGMVSIPGGAFELGKERVTVADLCMDRTEVTTATYLECRTRGPCRGGILTEATILTERKNGVERESALCNATATDRGSQPVNCVSWHAAWTYCRVHGKRLPTEAEWEWAARGGASGRKYPWGDAAPGPRSACSLLSDSIGTCVVASYSEGRTASGLEDMAGNVAEWTASKEGASWVFRGGSFLDSGFRLEVANRQWADPQNREVKIGFRCAQ
jgi:hypothetical protein